MELFLGTEWSSDMEHSPLVLTRQDRQLERPGSVSELISSSPKT